MKVEDKSDCARSCVKVREKNNRVIWGMSCKYLFNLSVGNRRFQYSFFIHKFWRHFCEEQSLRCNIARSKRFIFSERIHELCSFSGISFGRTCISCRELERISREVGWKRFFVSFRCYYNRCCCCCICYNFGRFHILLRFCSKTQFPRPKCAT